MTARKQCCHCVLTNGFTEVITLSGVATQSSYHLQLLGVFYTFRHDFVTQITSHRHHSLH